MTVSKASFPALAGYGGGSRSLTVRIGCTNGGSPCGSAGGANIANNVRGAEIDVNDPTAPRDLTVDASGLLRGGDVAGSDPVRVKVSDASGIRRVELIDVTGTPRRRRERGLRRRRPDRPRRDAARSASPRRARSSPTASTLRATSLQTGRRKLLVRAVDTGGNAIDRGPYDAQRDHAVRPRRAQRRRRDRGRPDQRPLHHRLPQDAPHDRVPLQGADRRPAAQRRRPADRRRSRRGAHPRPRRRRREAAHLRHDRRAGPLQVHGDRLRLAPVPVRVGLARQRRALRRQRLRHAAGARLGDAQVPPAHRVGSASGSSSTAASPASGRGAASTSSPRAARARTGAGARSPTARSAARA